MPDAMIGCMILGITTYPLTSNPDGVIATMIKDRNTLFLQMFMLEENIKDI